MKKILIHDSFPVIRIALERILNFYFNDCITDVVDNINELNKKAFQEKYDLIIIDLIIERCDYFKFYSKMQLLNPNCKFILFYDNEINSNKLKKFFDSENFFMLNKNCKEEEIYDYVNYAIERSTEINKLDFLIQNTIIKKSELTAIDKIQSLSSREFECVMHLMNGNSIVDISSKLNLAVTTVSTYKKRIFIKTETNSIVELTKLLIDSKINFEYNNK
ncbi:response regulator transcription factor [Flavobacterium helocola]|uniref:LuxR C-terminal-related transcriptional regulator n=1 Tax=Flavobacterium helocola TaxID=3139139 RepID=A0ABU9I8Y0_9FLAO